MTCPLTRIRGIAETSIITDGSVSDYEVMTGNIIEECDRLISMINTILDISETEAGVSRLDMTKINISELVRDARELFQPIAEDKRICLTQKIETDLSIYADNQKLQRVIANLPDNALKYTPTGGRIDISAYQDGQEIVISFCDNGIGISKEDLPYIFKRFYRCDRSRSQAGIGLGLSLAQAIVHVHGGLALVQNAPNSKDKDLLCLNYRKRILLFWRSHQ
jgi:signal transduction histidine kinase